MNGARRAAAASGSGSGRAYCACCPTTRETMAPSIGAHPSAVAARIADTAAARSLLHSLAAAAILPELAAVWGGGDVVGYIPSAFAGQGDRGRRGRYPPSSSCSSRTRRSIRR